MFDFAPTFDSLEGFATAQSTAAQKERTGQESSLSTRGRSLLHFRQRDTSGDAAETNRDEVQAGPEPRDPVAYPSYKTRAEGAAHPVYQFCEEPLPVEAAPPRPELAISKKTEVDIATFLEALSSAFPRPRDPLMPRVLRARPKQAARPFLYVAEQAVPEVSESAAVVEDADALKEPKDGIGKPALEIVSRAESGVAAEAPYDPILEGVGFKISWEKPVEINPIRPVEPHERELIDAVIEPREPMAKPRFPLQTEVAGAAQPRLSPSQRAHLKRPTVVRDCNGRLTAVTYSLNPQGKGQD